VACDTLGVTRHKSSEWNKFELHFSDFKLFQQRYQTNGVTRFISGFGGGEVVFRRTRPQMEPIVHPPVKPLVFLTRGFTAEEFPLGAPFPNVPFFTPVYISNQMRPRRLRVAWFSRLLRHQARRWSVSILSSRTHTELQDLFSKLCKL